MDWPAIRHLIDEMTEQHWFQDLPAEAARDLIGGTVFRLLATEPKAKKGFTPPTVAEVWAYCVERKNNVDAEAFVAFYESKGWKVGNQSMKDWKSSIITWEKRNGKERQGTSGLSGHLGQGRVGITRETEEQLQDRLRGARQGGDLFQAGPDLQAGGREDAGAN